MPETGRKGVNAMTTELKILRRESTQRTGRVSYLKLRTKTPLFPLR